MGGNWIFKDMKCEGMNSVKSRWGPVKDSCVYDNFLTMLNIYQLSKNFLVLFDNNFN